jgi:hypothetical protein
LQYDGNNYNNDKIVQTIYIVQYITIK